MICVKTVVFMMKHYQFKSLHKAKRQPSVTYQMVFDIRYLAHNIECYYMEVNYLTI